VKQILPLVFLVLVFVGGGLAYWKRDALLDFYHRHINTDQPASAYGPTGGSSAPFNPAYPVVPPDAPSTPPVSHLPPPPSDGEKQYAQPGTFYVIKRRKLVNRAGIQAVNPGELVRLLERLPDGRLRVTIDNVDFVMLPSEVTTDLDQARDAERQYFDTLRAQR
jgi:hypothetical protein